MSNFQLTLLGSVLVALSFLFPSTLWLLAPIGLGCFLYDLWFVISTLSGALLRGAIFGFVTASAAIFWFWSSIPIPFLGTEMVTQFLSVGIIWVLISFMLGLGTVLVTPCIFYAKRLPVTFATLPILTGALWAFQEYARMLFYGFVTYGGESLPGAHFSVSALGYAFAEHHYLLKFAQLAGVYSLSFAVAVCATFGALTWRAVRTQQKKETMVLAGLALLFLSLPLFFQQARHVENKPITLALITESGTDDGVKSEELHEFITRLVESRADIVIFPESSTPSLFYDEEARSVLASQLEGREVLFIYSRYSVTPGGTSHAELIYDSFPQGVRTTYDKQFLMPLGEYVPSFTRIVFAALNSEKLKHQIESIDSLLQRGERAAPVVDFKHTRVGGLLCSESLSPELYTNLAKNGARLLINASSVTWFHSDPRVAHLLYTLGKVHAVQHNTYFALAMKGASSAMIDPNGSIIAQSEYAKNSLLVVPISP